MTMRAPLALAVAMLACGCTYSLHEYQASGYAPAVVPPGPPRQAVRIHSNSEQFVVLGLAGDTDYVNEAYAKLLDQCAGEIVGVNTRFSTQLGFLSYTNKIDMQAMCLR
jgi:hypothetical protein